MHRRFRPTASLEATVRLLRPGWTTTPATRGSARRGAASRRAAVVILATIATVVGLAPSASAAYAPEPFGPTTWVPNGGVHSVVTDGSRVYVGGSFTGGVAALDARSGALLWLGNADGDVRALALGPNGSLLLGGAFTTVGGTTHRKLASVNAGSGAVNNTFKGTAGGTVRDIVVVGNTAYFGGAFTNHGGMAQQGLGAVDATTGALVTAFTPTANGTVYALGTDGFRLFIGGTFTAVNGLARNYLASVTLSSNAVDPWAPAKACTDCNVIWDLTLDNARNRVYTVGRNAGTLYTLDKSSGIALFRVTGGVNGDSQAVTLAPDGKVYVGGHFVTVSGQTRKLVAEFDVSQNKAVLGPFSANFVTSYPGVWAMASSPSGLYVAGDFTVAGSQIDRKKYPYFAMFPVAGSAPPADTIVPTVTVAPAGGTSGVAVNANVTASFSEPVQGVSGTTFRLTSGGASVPASVVQGAGNQWILDPTGDLTPGATYTATLTGGASAIRDLANNPLTTVTSTFTAAAPAGDTVAPTATLTPANGTSGVAGTTNVTANFSEPVQAVSGTTFTLTSGGASVPASVVQGAGNQWILDPTGDLTPGATYTATLTGGASAIRDLANNPLTTVTSTFTAAAPAGDTVAPTATLTPANGTSGVAATTNVTANFSEPVQAVSGTTFTLTSGGASVPASVVQGAGNQWILDPTGDLTPGATYTATLTGGASAIRDLANNPLTTVTSTFTVAGGTTGDTTAPTITAQTPQIDAKGVSRSANVTVAFSEPVQGVNGTTFTLTPAAGGPAVVAAVRFNSTSGRWVLDPSVTLEPTTSYTVTITSGVTDLATPANAFAGTSWKFTTQL